MSGTPSSVTAEERALVDAVTTASQAPVGRASLVWLLLAADSTMTLRRAAQIAELTFARSGQQSPSEESER